MNQPDVPTTRSARTGERTRKLSASIHLRGQLLPGRLEAADWAALRRWLGSSEFRAIADQVDFITITNHADPAE
ncbi:hypothetical protein [Actinomadura opuntiae]|uniref:hypothetical protein n=1 Tax=Actinomadura sp. OS1-43 TaxID=604315 RepID=UPI00255B0773|nr:hypothetical protein [Actinomadura sp. OS1-43]MDL4814978.1 hypothetical protein [Actinomadura sp. OS1-43]